MVQSKAASLKAHLRKFLFGAPIPTARAQHERLSLFFGLPIFASDALSSAAYATEAIVSILILYSVQAMSLQPAITIGICILYLIVVISYQQTVYAYPSGGGSYIVAADNLGKHPAVIAASALLIDYVLTVAVSVAAGVAALVSAFPTLHPFLIPMNIGFIAIIAWANLRGVRESGNLFAAPTYGFVLGMLVMIGFGFFKTLGQAPQVQQVVSDPGTIGKEFSLPFMFVFLRAFSAGCIALSGVEAISNGVQAFKAPESRNAALSLRWLAVLMITMFLGMGFLINFLPRVALYSTANPEYRTVVSQLAAFIFGQNSAGFYYIQFVTAAILILAANTAFADFPRLASILARDGFLPRPLARLGDRLVFQNGITVLAILAIALVWYFRGALDLLLPLYAVGVFTAFTLSQAGMVRRWVRLRSQGWSARAAINGLGAVLTGVVMVVILVTKFSEGAWIVLVLMSIMVTCLLMVRGRYTSITRQLQIDEGTVRTTPKHVAVLLVPRMHKGTLAALDYAKALHTDIRALHIVINLESLPQVREEWNRYAPDVPLVVLESPYRSLFEPILEYIDQMLAEDPNRMVTVIVAEAYALKWYHKFLQENIAQQIKTALGKRKNVVVSNVRYFLS